MPHVLPFRSILNRLGVGADKTLTAVKPTEVTATVAEPPVTQQVDKPDGPPESDILAEIDFSDGGNGLSYQLGGWSYQEPHFVWAYGERSELLLPEIGDCTGVILEFDLFPCLLPPYRTVQRVFVHTEHGLLGRADVATPGTTRIAVPDTAFAAGATRLILHHPDTIVPAEAGDHLDGRQLSIAYRRIAVRGRKAKAPAPAGVMPEKDLIGQFEGLGGTSQGCEFGVLQRQLGAEPLGLLRWTHIPADALADALEAQFDGVGTPEQTILGTFDGPGQREYCTEDRRFVMKMHTWVKETDKPHDEMFKHSCQRLRFLKRKLLDDLADGSKTFVYKSGDRICTEAQIRRIHAALRRYGPNTLLYVRIADAAHPAGSVEQVSDGLLIGYIAHYNLGAEGQVRPLARESWLRVCTEAYGLRERTKEAVLF